MESTVSSATSLARRRLCCLFGKDRRSSGVGELVHSLVDYAIRALADHAGTLSSGQGFVQ